VPPLSQIQIINSYSNNGTFYFIGQLYGKLSEKESLRKRREMRKRRERREMR